MSIHWRLFLSFKQNGREDEKKKDKKLQTKLKTRILHQMNKKKKNQTNKKQKQNKTKQKKTTKKPKQTNIVSIVDNIFNSIFLVRFSCVLSAEKEKKKEHIKTRIKRI